MTKKMLAAQENPLLLLNSFALDGKASGIAKNKILTALTRVTHDSKTNVTTFYFGSGSESGNESGSESVSGNTWSAKNVHLIRSDTPAQRISKDFIQSWLASKDTIPYGIGDCFWSNSFTKKSEINDYNLSANVETKLRVSNALTIRSNNRFWRIAGLPDNFIN